MEGEKMQQERRKALAEAQKAGGKSDIKGETHLPRKGAWEGKTGWKGTDIN